MGGREGDREKEEMLCAYPVRLHRFPERLVMLAGLVIIHCLLDCAFYSAAAAAAAAPAPAVWPPLSAPAGGRATL